MANEAVQLKIIPEHGKLTGWTRVCRKPIRRAAGCCLLRMADINGMTGGCLVVLWSTTRETADRRVHHLAVDSGW